ncbi:MAG: hypothetical protein SVU94_12640 [Bacteroidota bacterium]|nr:hypothetical protein [Bacteroidota bacterium]
MSLVHHIIPKQQPDMKQLNQCVLAMEGAKYEGRGEGTLYYWIDGKSTRGMDITMHDESIEIRNTVLSNHSDYQLTNNIVEELLDQTQGVLLNEDREEVEKQPLLGDQDITVKTLADCEMIQTLSQQHEDIAILGPKRKVHFGKRTHERFKSFKGETLKEKIFALMLKVNYEIPDYDYGQVVQAEDPSGEKKILQILTNKTNCIVDKYDYILLYTGTENPIMITNQLLNTMLPSNWELVDEFTIIAPVTSREEWNKLLRKTEPYNLF